VLPTKATNLRERLMPNASSAQVAMSDSNGIKRNVVCRPSSSAPANSNPFYRHASKQASKRPLIPAWQCSSLILIVTGFIAGCSMPSSPTSQIY
jgi:hypothetical protein